MKSAGSLMKGFPLLFLPLLGCAGHHPPATGVRPEDVVIFMESTKVPEGSTCLEELTIQSTRSEESCLKKLQRQASKLGANAIFVRSLKAEERLSEDYYPVVGRSIRREWTEIHMSASALRLPGDSVPTPLPEIGQDAKRAEPARPQAPEPSDAALGTEGLRLFHRAQEKADQGQWQDALAECLEAGLLLPDNLEVHQLTARVARELGNDEMVLTALKRALAIDPSNGDLAMQLGNIQMKMGRCEESLASYDLCLKAGFRPAQSYYNRGQALYALGRLEEALAAFSLAANLVPTWPDSYWNMAVTLEKLGRWSDANESWENYLKHAPESPETTASVHARIARNRQEIRKP